MALAVVLAMAEWVPDVWGLVAIGRALAVTGAGGGRRWLWRWAIKDVT